MLASTKLSKYLAMPATRVEKHFVPKQPRKSPQLVQSLIWHGSMYRGIARAPSLCKSTGESCCCSHYTTDNTLAVVRTSCMVTQGNQEWLERKEEEKFSLFFLDLRTNLSSFSFNHCLCNGFHAIASHLSLLLDLPPLYLFHYYILW